MMKIAIIFSVLLTCHVFAFPEEGKEIFHGLTTRKSRLIVADT